MEPAPGPSMGIGITNLGTYSPIFTQQEWEAYYPLKAYMTKTEHVRSFTLHYLLVLEKNESSLLEYIKKAKIEKLTVKDLACFNLSPIHIAVMRTNLAAIDAIFKRIKQLEPLNPCLETPDIFGFRPVHHALLCSEEIFKWLIAQGANQSAKTVSGATLKNLQALIGRVRAAKSLDYLELKVQGASSALPIEKRLELATGVLVYTDCPIYPPSQYGKLWRKALPSESDRLDDWSQKLLKTLYNEWKSSPPQLIVAECRELKGKTPFHFGLFAGQPIKKGRIVTTAPGLIQPQTPPKTAFTDWFLPSNESDRFLIGENQTEKVAGGGRFANCGWPNCVMIKIEIAEGASHHLLIALEDIPEGAPILWSYGFESIALSFGEQILIGKENMEAYFSQGLKARIQEIKSFSQDAGQSFLLYAEKLPMQYIVNLHGLNARFMFPLSSPKALLDLHFSHKVYAKQWMDLFLNPELMIIKNCLDQMPGPFFTLKSILRRILEFDAAFQNYPKARKIASKWILNQLDNLSIMQLLKGMQLASKDIALLLEKGDAFFQGLKLETYDWIKDEAAPLSLNQRRLDIYEEHRSSAEPKSKLIASFNASLAQMKDVGIDQKSESYATLEWLLAKFQADVLSSNTSDLK